MKKFLCALALLLILSGCSVPNSLQLDISQGFGRQTKLLHLNASNSERRQRIEDFASLLERAEPLDKDFSLFAYYPDYQMVITRDGQETAVIVDLNGDFVDFHYPDETQLYRSAMSSNDFRALLHQRVL